MKFLTISKTIISEKDVHTIYDAICNNLEKYNTTIHTKRIDEYVIFTIKPESAWVRNCLATTVTVNFMSEGTRTKVKFQFRLHKYLELFVKIYSILLLLIESILAVLLAKSQLTTPALLCFPVLIEGILLLILAFGLYLGSRKCLNIVCST